MKLPYTKFQMILEGLGLVSMVGLCLYDSYIMGANTGSGSNAV